MGIRKAQFHSHLGGFLNFIGEAGVSCAFWVIRHFSYVTGVGEERKKKDFLPWGLWRRYCFVPSPPVRTAIGRWLCTSVRTRPPRTGCTSGFGEDQRDCSATPCRPASTAGIPWSAGATSRCPGPQRSRSPLHCRPAQRKGEGEVVSDWHHLRVAEGEVASQRPRALSVAPVLRWPRRNGAQEHTGEKGRSRENWWRSWVVVSGWAPAWCVLGGKVRGKPREVEKVGVPPAWLRCPAGAPDTAPLRSVSAA